MSVISGFCQSMENYYYHPTPSSTFYSDYWQRGFGGVFRAHNMMNYYSPVMDEEEALSVLQQGIPHRFEEGPVTRHKYESL